MIILIRHAQSEGNKNRDIHQTTPDHRVKLTPDGYRQAQEAGRRLRDLLRPDDTLHFFTSPYRRTRETTEGILDSLTSDDPDPSPFPRNTIQVYEEPRLREQDFGNFQPCSTEMERMWMERADYGHFFYRIPNGESAADAYDRVSGFNESLWRLFGDDDFASVCVLVTHGLMTRVFLMKWYHWSVEYFEDLRNINHCEFVIMTHNEDNGKYSLQNKLRTWSDLRKERDAEKKREREAQGLSPILPPPTEHVPTRRKWGGCPDGCTHGLSADAKKSLRVRMFETMSQENNNQGSVEPKSALSASKDTKQAYRSQAHDSANGSDENDENSDSDHAQSNPRPEVEAEEAKRYRTGDSSSDARIKSASRPIRPALRGLHRDSEDNLLHPTAASSSSACLKLALLHLRGRDGGGSMSGANSLAPSDDEGEDNQTATQPFSGHLQSKPILNLPSQNAEDDGDDELSAHHTDEADRARPHLNHYTHHHYHHHHNNDSHDHASHHHYSSSTSSSQPAHRMANILGDGDDVSQHSDGHTPESSHQDPKTKSSSMNNNESEEKENLTLEEQQRQDQSVQGSIY